MTTGFVEQIIQSGCPVCKKLLACNLYIEIDSYSSSKVFPPTYFQELPHVLLWNEKRKIFVASTDVIGFPSVINPDKILSNCVSGTKLNYKFSCEQLGKQQHRYYGKSDEFRLYNNIPFNFKSVSWKIKNEQLSVIINGYDKFEFIVDRGLKTTTIVHRDYKVFSNSSKQLDVCLNLARFHYIDRDIMLEKLRKLYLLS